MLTSQREKVTPQHGINGFTGEHHRKAYYHDDNFKKEHGENEINLWKFYNMLTGANKSSCIDNFLDRSLNATQLTEGIDRALHGDNTYKWFIE